MATVSFSVQVRGEYMVADRLQWVVGSWTGCPDPRACQIFSPTAGPNAPLTNTLQFAAVPDQGFLVLTRQRDDGVWYAAQRSDRVTMTNGHHYEWDLATNHVMDLDALPTSTPGTSVQTQTDNTRRYIIYAVLGVVAYKVLQKVL
jgi:hypothetical protein